MSLTSEQEQLVAMVSQLVQQLNLGSPRPRQPAPFESDGWRAILDTGLVGVGVDESVGGSGGSSVDTALVVEGLASGPVAVPYLGSVLVLSLLGAVTDPGPSVAGRLVDLRAHVLAGRGAAIVLAEDLVLPSRAGVVFDPSDDCIVVGQENGSLFLGELSTSLDSVDLTRRLARGIADTPLANADPARMTRWLAFALVMMSADLLGVMSASLDCAVSHAKERVQFGRPVASFQAVQQLCADQLVTIESARSSLWHAAWAVDALEPAAALSAARVTKAYCSEVARDVCEAAIQVWGGIGMTWECPAHLYLRRALLSRQVLGDEHWHLSAIADEIVGPVHSEDGCDR